MYHVQPRRRNDMPAAPVGSEPGDGVVRVVPETDDIVAVGLEGEFDLGSTPMLREEFDRALQSRKHLIVDLSQTTFIDSSVIHVLFGVAKGVGGSGRTAVLQLGTAPLVERALTIAEIERVMPRVHRREEAIELIQRRAAGE
jgi:anti-anti-sigma factor